MITSFRTLLLTGVLVAAGLAATPALRAQFVSDDFTGTGSLSGRSPNLANQPGTLYTTFSYDTTQGTQPSLTGTGRANTGFNGQSYLNIGSNGSYTKPGQFRLSLTVNIGGALTGIQPDATVQPYNRGIGLGLFGTMLTNPTNSGTDSGANFSGLILSPTGALTLVSNGTAGVSTNITGFSNTADYTLAYSLNTATGVISNVTVNGVATGFGAGTVGTVANATSNYAGFLGSSAAYNSTGTVDNFSLVSVPEPATWLGGALLAGICLFGARRHLGFALRA